MAPDITAAVLDQWEQSAREDDREGLAWHCHPQAILAVIAELRAARADTERYVVTITNRLPKQDGMSEQRHTLAVGPFADGDAARTWLQRYQAVHPGRGDDTTTQPDLGMWLLTPPMRTDEHVEST